MRNRRRIGVLDVFMGMLLLLGAIGLILRARILQSEVEVNETCAVICLARGVPADMAECLHVGEILYTADGSVWGVLREVEARPAEISVLQNGEHVSGVDPTGERLDLTLTVAVSGATSESGFLRDGKYVVLRGEGVLLYSERCALSLQICFLNVE